jgi:hypothetical protein
MVIDRSWRGAALQFGSSVCWLQAAPGNGPRTRQVYPSHPVCRRPEWNRWVEALRWIIRGSRLQPTYRTATLQSGSPPDVGHGTPGAFIRRRNEAPPYQSASGLRSRDSKRFIASVGDNLL